MMTLDETDDRFCAGPSRIPGAGQGLFARVPLRSGDRLKVIGVLVARDSDADRYTAFADEYKLRVGDQHLLIPFGVAAMTNHSSQPNLVKVIEGTELFLELLRDVDAGEELCFSYSEFARAQYGLD
ncbi:MAG: SET domain-containing protein-lysine N-methyltransferase [Acidobacteria bacterium]|nr:SET domain-containing protein-lysine N-methyltransferase [Acidobacteriota bacterium]